jgi:hypothetical protein
MRDGWRRLPPLVDEGTDQGYSGNSTNLNKGVKATNQEKIIRII